MEIFRESRDETGLVKVWTEDSETGEIKPIMSYRKSSLPRVGEDGLMQLLSQTVSVESVPTSDEL